MIRRSKRIQAAQNSELLDSAAAIGFHKSRDAPVFVGHALHTSAERGTGLSDDRDISQYGAAGNIAIHDGTLTLHPATLDSSLSTNF